jgi:hypothetical protein
VIKDLSNLNQLYFMRNINTRRLLGGDYHNGGSISTEEALFKNRYFMNIYVQITTIKSPYVRLFGNYTSEKVKGKFHPRTGHEAPEGE